MPKHEFVHRAGLQVPERFASILQDLFGSQIIDKVERLGAKISVVVTTPYSPKTGKSHLIKIDRRFIDELISVRADARAVLQRLEDLSVKQLRTLGGELGHPVRTKSSKHECIAELLTYIQSEDVWNRITGNQPMGPPPSASAP